MGRFLKKFSLRICWGPNIFWVKILSSRFQNFKNGEIQKWPNLLEKFSMVPDIGFHFWIAHLVDLVEIYKMQVSEVESEVGNHTEFSQQICLFLRSVLLPFWKFFWHAQNRLVKELWPNRGREHGYFQHSKNDQNSLQKFWKFSKIFSENSMVPTTSPRGEVVGTMLFPQFSIVENWKSKIDEKCKWDPTHSLWSPRQSCRARRDLSIALFKVGW